MVWYGRAAARLLPSPALSDRPTQTTAPAREPARRRAHRSSTRHSWRRRHVNLQGFADADGFPPQREAIEIEPNHPERPGYCWPDP